MTIKRIFQCTILVFIMGLFFIRDHASREYLREFKYFPSITRGWGVFSKIQIPFWLDPNVQDFLGYSFLHYAVERSDTTMLIKLLQRGARPDPSNILGQTPLHLAAIYGQTKSVNILAGAGAKLDKNDKNHKTPIFYAVERGAFSSVKLFKLLGANLMVIDILGHTLLDRAVLHGYRDIVLYLLPLVSVQNTQQVYKIVGFLDAWKKKYNTFFHIKPIYQYGILEYNLAQWGILYFTDAEDMGIKIYLYKRQARRNPKVTFDWSFKKLFNFSL